MAHFLLQGHALDILRNWPAEFFNCCVTSPPYWGLRDYKTEPQVWGGNRECRHEWTAIVRHRASGGPQVPQTKWAACDSVATAQRDTISGECSLCGAWRGHLGGEPTPEMYVSHLVEIFREVRRVLRDDGTLWLNLGDSYAATHHGKQGENHGDNFHPTGQAYIDNVTGVRREKQISPGLKPKDLVGIPWRVAFALQQPYETVTIKERIDQAWLAALIDGEGCITTTVAQPTTGINESYAIVLQVRISDRECLDRIVEITGMSKVQDETLCPSMVAANQRPASCWKIAGENAATVLAEIYPFLRIKRRQALVAWNLQRLKDGVTTKRGVCIPAENMELRRELHRIIRALNQREAAEVPDWCREPEYTIEPRWYLRSDVIWSKPNPMPESMRDRPTKAHEYIFLLSKSERYFYNAEAVREPSAGVLPWGGKPEGKIADDRAQGSHGKGSIHHAMTHDEKMKWYVNGRNRRSVWTIATHPYKGAHFATFPPELARTCLLAGCPREGKTCDCDELILTPLGSGLSDDPTLDTGRAGMNRERRLNEGSRPITRREQRAYADQMKKSPHRAEMEAECGPAFAHYTRTDKAGARPLPPDILECWLELGWLADPAPCQHETGAGIVLDPFVGSGTLPMVATQLGMDAVGIDLNSDYIIMAEKRVESGK